MMINKRGSMLSLVFITLLSGCSTVANTERDEAIETLTSDSRLGEAVNRICFTSGIDRFSDNTRHSVVLTEGVDDDFLLIVRQCRDLERAQSLRLDNRSQCLRRYDRIRVYDTAFGTNLSGSLPYDLCVIEAIYEWDRDTEGPDTEGPETERSDTEGSETAP